MRSHEIDYTILGESIQLVNIALDPGETVIAEAGAMMYMDPDINFETKMGDGSNPSQGFIGKLFSAGSRLLTGESLFMTHFTSEGRAGKSNVGFSAPYPGTVVPIDLSRVAENTLITQKDSFLCAALGTKVSITLNKKLGSGLVGGEGFILQKLHGDGMAFVHAGGTVVERQLNNEKLRVDTGCVVAFENTLDFDITASGGLKSMLFGGEGIFLATLSGTGKVWMQSMPIRKLVAAIAPFGKNSNKGDNNILGSFLEKD